MLKTLAIFNHHIVLLCDVLWRYKYMKEDMSSSSMIWIVEWKLKRIPVVVHVCSDRYWLRADLLHNIVMRIRTACCWFYMLPLVLTGTDVHLASLCFMFDCLFQNPWDLMLSFRMIFFFCCCWVIITGQGKWFLGYCLCTVQSFFFFFFSPPAYKIKCWHTPESFWPDTKGKSPVCSTQLVG